MTEINIGWLASLSGLGLVISSTLYWWGGSTNKLWRRLGGALVLSTTVLGISTIFGNFKPILSLTSFVLFAGFSNGYGINDGDLVKKIIRRSIYAVGVCGAGLIYCFTCGGKTWLILPLHIGVGAWSVWLAVKNPLHAKAEEWAISMLLNFGLILYPFCR